MLLSNNIFKSSPGPLILLSSRKLLGSNKDVLSPPIRERGAASSAAAKSLLLPDPRRCCPCREFSGCEKKSNKNMSKYAIVMVRHGESEWNQQNLFCGWYDANLSEKGKIDRLLLRFHLIQNSKVKRSLHRSAHTVVFDVFASFVNFNVMLSLQRLFPSI